MVNKTNKPPAFQFYANDFLIDIAEWDNIAVGVYIKLLCYQWTNGTLSKDKKILARITQENEANFERIWKQISPKFEEKFDRIYNKRLEKVRKERQKFIETSVKSGHKGADKRWHSKPHSEPYSKPHSKNIALQSSSSPSSSSSISSSSSSKTVTPQAEFVENWQKLYKAKTGHDYKADTKDFILISKLLKNYSSEVVLMKAKLLFELCEIGEVWFAKSMADFTIGKLSSRWNEIIPQVKKKDKSEKVRDDIERALEGVKK